MKHKTILPVAVSKELGERKPIRVCFDESYVVLFRTSQGISAFLDACPHRGVPLSKGCVKKGNIKCMYHGWQFNDKGVLIDVPGDPNFKSYSSPVLTLFYAKEYDGLIWLSRNKFSCSELFTPMLPPTHEHATVVKKINANKIEIAENFLDALHTHSIHTGIIRSSKLKNRCTVTVQNVIDGYEASYIEDRQQTGILSRLFGSQITKGIGRIRQPGIIELEYITADNAIEMSVVIYIIEEREGACKLILRTYLKKSKVPFIVKALLLAPFQFLVLHQDKKVLELQHKSLTENPNFKPIVRKTDIMRRYIEKTYEGTIEECNVKLEIML